MITDSNTFIKDTRLQAQWQTATPPQVNVGSVSVPLPKSGSYAYKDFNISLGTLTLTKLEILNSGKLDQWYFTCTGSGSWTGIIEVNVGGILTTAGTFTLKSGRIFVQSNCGVEVDGYDMIGACLVKGAGMFGNISSVIVTFKSA